MNLPQLILTITFVCHIKYLQFLLDGDISFVLHPPPMDVFSAYGHSMGDIDTMYDSHRWCIIITIKFKAILDFFRGVVLVPIIYIAQTNTVIVCIAMEVFPTAPSALDRQLCQFL